ncbi:hypothetical protein GWK47_038835 [Chionoecetes opilio]|uniref:Uncharacterized protein n=1 Tax=Chionoecetes opilio TaxID=41210 RepID=A0A8J4YDJ0_CHIOP|nr:hypothetical protein GWK47_038835 [Chionoecetes opilio]
MFPSPTSCFTEDSKPFTGWRGTTSSDTVPVAAQSLGNWRRNIEISSRAPEQPCSPSPLGPCPQPAGRPARGSSPPTWANPTTFPAVPFPKREGAFVPKLHLSPRVEPLIGGAASLALPAVARASASGLRGEAHGTAGGESPKTIHDF